MVLVNFSIHNIISALPNLSHAKTGRCSSNGYPGRKNSVVIRNSRKSIKCGCNAGFTFDSIDGSLVFKEHKPSQPHHSECCQLSVAQLQNKAHVFRGLQSPEAEKSRLDFVTSMFADDYSTRSCQVTNLLNGQIRRSATDECGVLPTAVAYAAPKAYTDTLIRAGKAAANGNISPTQAVSALITFFHNEGITYDLQNDMDENGDEVVSAIVFHDKVLAPTMTSPCSVYTADVTFGLTDASCGFSKWFFLSRLLAGKYTFSEMSFTPILRNLLFL